MKTAAVHAWILGVCELPSSVALIGSIPPGGHRTATLFGFGSVCMRVWLPFHYKVIFLRKILKLLTTCVWVSLIF